MWTWDDGVGRRRLIHRQAESLRRVSDRGWDQSLASISVPQRTVSYLVLFVWPACRIWTHILRRPRCLDPCVSYGYLAHHRHAGHRFGKALEKVEMERYRQRKTDEAGRGKKSVSSRQTRGRARNRGTARFHSGPGHPKRQGRGSRGGQPQGSLAEQNLQATTGPHGFAGPGWIPSVGCGPLLVPKERTGGGR
ncbi:hypothetical protein VTG60DRAFT_5600 [Thermothelomyces hinnuleus]